MRWLDSRLSILAIIGFCGWHSALASGQEPKPANQPSSLIGFNAGALTDGRPGPWIPTYGFQWTRLQCLPLCGDLALGVSPGGGFGMRLGATAPLAVGTNALILPSAGLSGVIGPGWGNNVAATGGLFAGVSAVVGLDWGVAPRVGATIHWIIPLQFPVYLLEAGLTIPLRPQQ